MANESWDCMKAPGVARRLRCGLSHCETCGFGQKQPHQPTDQPVEIPPVMSQAYRQYPELDFDIEPADLVKFLENSVALKTTFTHASFVHKFMLQAVQVIRKLCEQRQPERESIADQIVNYIKARIGQHTDNLHLWQNGFLTPTEPDEDERDCVMRELDACITELRGLLAQPFMQDYARRG